MSSRQNLIGINNNAEHVGGRIDLLRDIFICASSLCFCGLMEKALMQIESAKCLLCPRNTQKIQKCLFCKGNIIFSLLLYISKS